jgi:transposase
MWLAQLTGAVEQVGVEVEALARQDAVVHALDGLVGIGPVLGLMIRAEIGTITRFPTAAHLASYAGIVPRVEQTGSRCYYGRITRQGSPWLRWALVEAAIHRPRRADDLGRWAARLQREKGRLKARVAVAHRLCTEVFRTWPRSA